MENLANVVQEINLLGESSINEIDRAFQSNVFWLYRELKIFHYKFGNAFAQLPELEYSSITEQITTNVVINSYENDPNLKMKFPCYRFGDIETKKSHKGKSPYSDIIDKRVNTDDSYEMSDCEDEEPMKTIDLNLNSEFFNGKPIPKWAYGQQLKMTANRQNASDGDLIFWNLPKRCNLIELFGTTVFKYYSKKKYKR